MSFRPLALSIAGFDPSAGAGALADIKTFEQLGVYGIAACSALTFQTDEQFDGISWVSFDEVEEQLVPLFERFDCDWIKIGLVQDFEVLGQLVNLIKSMNSSARIIWDPILKASAGFTFHSQVDLDVLKPILSKLFLITPNIDEAIALSNLSDVQEGARKLAKSCKVLLKGGHAEGENVEDVLFEEKDQVIFRQTRLHGVAKHGSGCILSAALTAFLALGNQLQDACKSAQEYTRAVLLSNTGRLGYHSGGSYQYE